MAITGHCGKYRSSLQATMGGAGHVGNGRLMWQAQAIVACLIASRHHGGNQRPLETLGSTSTDTIKAYKGREALWQGQAFVANTEGGTGLGGKHRPL